MKPWLSVPDIPANGAELTGDDVVEVVDDDVADGAVVVMVVVLGGGAASRVCGDVPLFRFPKIKIDASTRAAPSSTITAAASATCDFPNFLSRGGGGPGGPIGDIGGGYGV
jgi:hypothetical protein